ncbi:hypothetical protein SAMN05519105_1700 [Rhodobacter sp. 24-YEA-8]|nr:hypothetical protein SAMN05519105_1700 [Rhodobacter sp. 24-YEA-8]
MKVKYKTKQNETEYPCGTKVKTFSSSIDFDTGTDWLAVVSSIFSIIPVLMEVISKFF